MPTRQNTFNEISTRFDADKVSKVFPFDRSAKNKSFNFQPNREKLQDFVIIYNNFLKKVLNCRENSGNFPRLYKDTIFHKKNL
jgi:hypothetical protein